MCVLYDLLLASNWLGGARDGKAPMWWIRTLGGKLLLVISLVFFRWSPRPVQLVMLYHGHRVGFCPNESPER
jgi:hypothetical protein